MSEIIAFPYRYAPGKMALQIPSNGTGYKQRAHRLAEAIGFRWVGRARGYVGSTTQVDRLRRLHAAGWDSHLMLWAREDYSAHRTDLPEPWMKRRARLWIAPPAPAASA